MYLILYAIVPLLVTVTSAPLDLFEIDPIVDFASTIVSTELKFLDSLDNEDTAKAISETLKRMNTTKHELESFMNNLLSLKFFFSMINHLRSSINHKDDLLEILHNMDEMLFRIKDLYDFYENFSNEQFDIDAEKFNNWVNASTSNEDNDLFKTLDKLYSIIMNYESGNDNFFHLIAPHFSHLYKFDICGYKLSIQQRLHYFYQMIMINQLHGFLMIVYGNTMKAIMTKKVDKSIYEKAEAQAVLSIAQYMLAVKPAMSGIPRGVETCDTEMRTTDTYASFSGFLQEILVNLIDLPPRGDCVDKCETINNVRVDECTEESPYCAKRLCFGILYSCWPIGGLRTCELPADSIDRRYQFHRADTGDVYGTPKSCHPRDGPGISLRANSLYHKKSDQWCTICSCLCAEEDRDSPALRSVSYRPQISAIQDNMVVAGIRIIQADRLIQLEIKQGKLLANGRIDPTTIVWKEREKMHYDGVNVSGGAFDIFNEKKRAWERLERNKDYVFLDYADRGFHLDEVTIDDGYIMTGARWNYVPNRSNTVTQIEVHATKYDYKTGKLDPETSKWVTPQNMPNPPKPFYNRDRSKLYTEGYDHPLKSPEAGLNSEPNQYIIFDVTGRKEDAAQTTVPFFDTQLVQTNPAIASVGLQVIQRRASGYSGFVALRLIAVDLSKVWTIQSKKNISKYKKNFSAKLPYDLM